MTRQTLCPVAPIEPIVEPLQAKHEQKHQAGQQRANDHAGDTKGGRARAVQEPDEAAADDEQQGKEPQQQVAVGAFTVAAHATIVNQLNLV